ncbi:MAG: nascent polypeptide-associated complex protein [Candidatus Bathyarchaeota archaeon]|nr:MAG: nascent polypeptide-associated complex protein [Candidatus Bathyarchaeota archaeon]
MSRVNSRRARRMMKQMGLKMDELGDIERVIFQGKKREIVIEGPAVTSINMQGQRMYQVVGGEMREEALEAQLEIPEEDILLVAQQTGVSVERARAALEDTEGDLARAILMLTTG